MLLRLLRPRWLGIHLATVLVTLGCLTGAYWQYEAAKEPERDALPTPETLRDPVDISSVSEPGGYLPLDDTNQAVSATGTYDTANQLFAPGPAPDGEPGFYVVTPLVTGDDVAVAVNRGWLPQDAVDSGAQPPPAAEGTVTVTGWLTPPQREPASGYSAVAVTEGHIERISSALLVNQWPYQLYEGYITLAEQTPQPPPERALAAAPPRETPEKYDWNARNLGYSAQWALFGVVACVFWVSLVRRELRGDGGAESGTGESGAGDTDDAPGGDTGEQDLTPSASRGPG